MTEINAEAVPGTGANLSRPPLLQMRGITKSFFGVPVLDAVDLDVMASEVHAVVGANGANDADPVALNQ